MATIDHKTWINNATERDDSVLSSLKQCEEFLWLNPKLVKSFDEAKNHIAHSLSDIVDASERLERFAAYFREVFPETQSTKGIIESPLLEATQGKQAIAEFLQASTPEKLLIKCDSHLPISGSIKARGGIYEVLYHAEQLALKHGLLSIEDDYACFAGESFKTLFAEHSIVVGSTGNLGLSIGIMSAKLGFKVTVHMSADAREWKKALLRSKGVNVVEHQSDYSVAVTQGRKEALSTPNCHFIDDEDSQTLFLGYAVAALRLQQQLKEQNIRVDAEHPLVVYLPCGVGGGPGGIAFGLKHVFGDAVHCFFAEPTHSPCMLLGMHSQLHNGISVQDIGLDNLTCADGLAVGRASAFVGGVMDHILDGIYTISDERMYALLKILVDTEELSVEPSATAGLTGCAWLNSLTTEALESIRLTETSLKQATHLAWATGGNMVPVEEHQKYYSKGVDAFLAF